MGLGCAKVVVFEPVDLSGFSSTFEQNRFAKFLLPRNRGRRWPTGRMRGSAGLTLCEQSPLTLPSPPIRLRRSCIIMECADTQTNWGRGDTLWSFQMEQILARDGHAECFFLRSPVPPYKFENWPAATHVTAVVPPHLISQTSAEHRRPAASAATESTSRG